MHVIDENGPARSPHRSPHRGPRSRSPSPKGMMNAKNATPQLSIHVARLEELNKDIQRAKLDAKLAAHRAEAADLHKLHIEALYQERAEVTRRMNQMKFDERMARSEELLADETRIRDEKIRKDREREEKALAKVKAKKQELDLLVEQKKIRPAYNPMFVHHPAAAERILDLRPRQTATSKQADERRAYQLQQQERERLRSKNRLEQRVLDTCARNKIIKAETRQMHATRLKADMARSGPLVEKNKRIRERHARQQGEENKAALERVQAKKEELDELIEQRRVRTAMNPMFSHCREAAIRLRDQPPRQTGTSEESDERRVRQIEEEMEEWEIIKEENQENIEETLARNVEIETRRRRLWQQEIDDKFYRAEMRLEREKLQIEEKLRKRKELEEKNLAKAREKKEQLDRVVDEAMIRPAMNPMFAHSPSAVERLKARTPRRTAWSGALQGFHQLSPTNRTDLMVQLPELNAASFPTLPTYSPSVRPSTAEIFSAKTYPDTPLTSSNSNKTFVLRHPPAQLWSPVSEGDESFHSEASGTSPKPEDDPYAFHPHTLKILEALRRYRPSGNPSSPKSTEKEKKKPPAKSPPGNRLGPLSPPSSETPIVDHITDFTPSSTDEWMSRLKAEVKKEAKIRYQAKIKKKPKWNPKAKYLQAFKS